MDILPIDVLCLIFKHLSFATLVQNMTVNKKWYKAFCSYVDNNMIVFKNSYLDNNFVDILEKFHLKYFKICDGYFYKLPNYYYNKSDFSSTNLTKKDFRYINDFNIVNLSSCNLKEKWFNKIKLNAKKINLTENKLSGRCFYNFKNINIINISSNNINKKYWHLLSHVNKLVANNTNLDDDDLKHFSDIKIISLKNNNITNYGLVYLKNVEDLNIKNNEGIDHNCFYYIPNKYILSKFTAILDISKLDKKLFDIIDQYINLKTLNISRPGEHEDKQNYYHKDFKYVTKLKITRYTFHMYYFKSFSNINKLYLKDVTTCKNVFKFMDNIKTVYFNRCRLVGMKNILDLKNIENMCVIDTRINVKDLLQFNNLICLHIEYNDKGDYVKDDCLELNNLVNLPKLEVFTFEFNNKKLNKYLTYAIENNIAMTMCTQDYKKLHKMY